MSARAMTCDEVQTLRELAMEGEPISALAEEVGVSFQTACDAVNGTHYKDCTGPVRGEDYVLYNGEILPRVDLREDDVARALGVKLFGPDESHNAIIPGVGTAPPEHVRRTEGVLQWIDEHFSHVDAGTYVFEVNGRFVRTSSNAGEMMARDLGIWQDLPAGTKQSYLSGLMRLYRKGRARPMYERRSREDSDDTSPDESEPQEPEMSDDEPSWGVVEIGGGEEPYIVVKVGEDKYLGPLDVEGKTAAGSVAHRGDAFRFETPGDALRLVRAVPVACSLERARYVRVTARKRVVYEEEDLV